MSANPLEEPLSQDELDEFGRILDAAEEMPLEVLQGYLCAIVCAPVRLAVADWLPATLAEEPPERDAAQKEKHSSLMTRLFNQQVRALEGGGDAALVLSRDEVIDEFDYEPWCSGFLVGIDIAWNAWTTLADMEELDELLYPFRFLAGEFDKELRPRFSREEWKKEKQQFGADLWAAVLDLNRYGGALRNRPTTVRRDAPKVGRNDPCACGSGKKFKNCCGRA